MGSEDLTYRGAVPVDACANENGVPRIPRLIRLVELVGPTDITLGRVPNEIDSLRRGVDTMRILSPLLQKPGSELEGT